MRLLLTVVFGATGLVGSAAESIDHHNNEQVARALQEEADAEENCPSAFSLMHCVDPSIKHDIPCDETTCLWDLTAFQSDAPPGICGFIHRINVNDDLPDDLKPCVLWNQFFGTVAPTISPAPTQAPVPMPTTDVPTAAPTVDSRIFKVTLDRKVINLFFRSPSGLVNQALNDAWALADLEDTLNRYLQKALRTRTGHDIATESVLVPIEDASAPWKNSTAVAIMALTTRIKSDSTVYERRAFHIFVADALREEALLETLQTLEHAPLERIYGIHVGPLYTEDAPSRDIQSDRPTGEATDAGKEMKWTKFWTKEFWNTIQWGEWTDKDFISFVVVMAAFTLFSCLFVLTRCCRRFRTRKLERDVLAAAKLTMEDESVLYAASDSEPSETGLISEIQPEEASIRSETYSYTEDDSRDIQSFSVGPGTNMSALDFSLSKYASPQETSKLLQRDIDDEESVGSRSTISHQPVDLEQGKGTVVCYDVDNDSLSTTSDSMVGSMLDFVRAAWQKKKPHSPRQSIFNQKIPKVPVARHTQSSVMAVVASLEAAAKSTSPKPPSPRKINLLSVVEEIERENQKPVELKSQSGTSSHGTEEVSLESQPDLSSSISAQNSAAKASAQSVESQVQGSVASVTRQEERASTPEPFKKPAAMPFTPHKQAPAPRKLTLESMDDDVPPDTVVVVAVEHEAPECSKPAPSAPSSIEGDKKPSVLAVAAAFEKSSTDVSTPPVVIRPKKPSSVMAAIASFEQSSKKTVTTSPTKDFATRFRELASKKTIVSTAAIGKDSVPKKPMTDAPINNSRPPERSPVRDQKSPVSILRPTVTKGRGSVMDAIKALEGKSPVPIEGRPKPIKHSVSFDNSLTSLSQTSQSPVQPTAQDRPSRDLSSPVRLSKLMDDTASNSTKKTVGTSSVSSTSDCISPGERNKSSFILRTNRNEEEKEASSPPQSPDQDSLLPFFRSRNAQEDRSKTDALQEKSGLSILRSWSDKPPTDSYSSPAFSGKSARKSKASKLLLKNDSDEFLGSTPATLPATPLSPIEYQESETSDIKSICSKECFGISPMR